VLWEKWTGGKVQMSRCENSKDHLKRGHIHSSGVNRGRKHRSEEWDKEVKRVLTCSRVEAIWSIRLTYFR